MSLTTSYLCTECHSVTLGPDPEDSSLTPTIRPPCVPVPSAPPPPYPHGQPDVVPFPTVSLWLVPLSVSEDSCRGLRALGWYNGVFETSLHLSPRPGCVDEGEFQCLTEVPLPELASEGRHELPVVDDRSEDVGDVVQEYEQVVEEDQDLSCPSPRVHSGCRKGDHPPASRPRPKSSTPRHLPGHVPTPVRTTSPQGAGGPVVPRTR